MPGLPRVYGLLSLVLLSVWPTVAPAKSSSQFFVATNGHDGWSGRLATPNRARTDGPWASPAQALRTLRERRQHGGLTGEVTVWLRGGTYALAAPLVFRPEDGGAPGALVTWAAYRREQPVLSAGRRLAGWRLDTLNGRQVWAVDLPEVQAGRWFFRELWVNGKRCPRARHPNQGYLKIERPLDVTPQTPWNEGQARFQVRPGDVQHWRNLEDVEMVVMNRWVDSRLPVRRVEASAGVIECGKKTCYHLEAGDLYYAEHSPDLLDAPGEWYLDRRTGVLYYLARSGEDMTHAEVVAPVGREVIRLEGRPGQGPGIRHLVFRGLTFSHAQWLFPEDLEPDRSAWAAEPLSKARPGGFAQAAVGVTGGVWGEGVRQCRFEGCRFQQLGGYGLELGRGCVSNQIAGCTFTDLGGGGIKLGEPDLRQRPEEQTWGNEISDCRLVDGGKLFHAAVGMWLGQTWGNRIAHNLVQDFYYTGLSIGWTWGYGPSFVSNNVIEWNEVRYIGRKSDGDGPILSDLSGIYTLGVRPTTWIRNNRWRDIAAIRYGGWGIYFDEGSTGVLAVSNIVSRTTHGGFHQHYGRENRVWNNLFAAGEQFQVQRTLAEGHLSFTFATNIVWFETGTLFQGNWSSNFVADANLYEDARPDAMRRPVCGKETWASWQRRGQDAHSRRVSAGLADPRRDDFGLSRQSPARALGFQPLDLTGVGPRTGQRRLRTD